MAMLIGDRKRIAIEAEVDERTTSGLVFGRLRFWLDGQKVGNWNDCTDLKGCANWLRDFFERPRLRFESRFVGLSAADVFKQVHASAMGDSESIFKPSEIISDAFSRFYISHLGMSSFDQVDMLLLKDEAGIERVIWRAADEYIHEVILEPDEMERVAERFCLAFEAQLA